MTLCAELLGGERVIRVALCRPILQASLCHGLSSEDISIYNVESTPVEADIVSNHKVAGSKETPIRLLHTVPPDQHTLHQPIKHLSATSQAAAHGLPISQARTSCRFEL